jgi:hypothetical protein
VKAAVRCEVGCYPYAHIADAHLCVALSNDEIPAGPYILYLAEIALVATLK